MFVTFSLNKEISQERIIKEISDLVSKNIKSQSDADSTVLVIRLQKINQIVDAEIPKIEC